MREVVKGLKITLAIILFISGFLIGRYSNKEYVYKEIYHDSIVRDTLYNTIKNSEEKVKEFHKEYVIEKHRIDTMSFDSNAEFFKRYIEDFQRRDTSSQSNL